MNLNEILNAREARWNLKRALARDEKSCVVSLTMRMPQELRLTGDAEKALEKAAEETLEVLKNEFCLTSFKGRFTSPDGPYALIAVSADGVQIKKRLVRLEEESRLGDLIDIDVMTQEGDEISRLSVGGSPRKCLVCEKNDARVCAANRTHPRQITIETFQNILSERLYGGKTTCSG